MGKKILIGVIICIILSSGIFYFFMKDMFLIKKVEVKKDFLLDQNNFIDYLGITSERYIWEYKIKELEEKIAVIPFIDKYEVSKKYPAKLVINLEIRQPILRIQKENGEILFVDSKGVVFQKSKNNGFYPVLICDINNDIKKGFRLTGKYKEIISLFSNLKKKDAKIFESISQVEISKENHENYHYKVYFRTINTPLYLKNSINVEKLIKGISSILLLEEFNIEFNSLFDNQIGIFYQ
ncbi:MAG: FtsQ-type POTRA domain-containing protein [Spirochaetes bacterium]|nr:FtsQ-type POTRA domain-containing protein [Spirochaetota bacterium]